MIAFVIQYALPIVAGIVLALIVVIYLVLSLRAYRRHTTQPRAIWAALVFTATMLSLAFLNAHFRVHPRDVDSFVTDMMVAAGTMLVVFVVVVVPIGYCLGRSTPAMTESEREAWLARSNADLDFLAKLFVGTHAVSLTYGAYVVLALLVIAVMWALVR